jgi:hypothetical protein
MTRDLKLVAESEPVPPGGGKIGKLNPLSGPSMYALLVREAVQNSWDARDDDRGNAPVHFSMTGFDLDTTEANFLRSIMPVRDLKGFSRLTDTDDGKGDIHPQAVLERDRIKLLIISDRNTVGLCGPTLGGMSWEPKRLGKPLARGQQRFANFVRNTGRSEANTGIGDGGAFGIGKSALWMTSECGTVLIHTRTTDEHGDPVDRFIGSIWGSDFESGDHQYTGRHFIGRRSRSGLIEPLEGAEADQAVEGLPIPNYEVDGRPAFGTTVMIVAPRMHLGWDLEMNRLRDAIRWHVWPKRVPAVRGEKTPPDMEMRLAWNNNPVKIPEPLSDMEIRPYALALQHCVTQRQHEDSSSEDSIKMDFEARCHRPLKKLGDLKFREGGAADDNVFHTTQILDESDLPDGTSELVDDELIDIDPVIDFEKPWGKTALIRREPLLLVKYRDIPGQDTQRFVGVYLSEDDAEIEAALTEAEPPAHDEWKASRVPKEYYRRTYVKRTLAEIKRIEIEFAKQCRDSDSGHSGSGEQELSRLISVGMLGGLGGGPVPPTTTDPDPDRTRRSRRPSASLVVVDTWPTPDGAMHELNVVVSGVGTDPIPVDLRVNAIGLDNAGSVPVGGLVSFEWRIRDREAEFGPIASVSAIDGFKVVLIIRVVGDLRIRPKVTVTKRGENG